MRPASRSHSPGSRLPSRGGSPPSSSSLGAGAQPGLGLGPRERDASAPLSALFYAVFDDEEGPKIQRQVGERSLSEETFERLASLILPKLELCGRLMAVHAGEVQLVFFPLSLASPRYARHRFSFTFGMAIAAEGDAGPFRPVLKKMARVFADLEMKAGFLSSGGLTDALLARVMDDLVTRGEVMVRLDQHPTTPLALKLFPRLLEPPRVSDYHVPVLVRNLRPLVNRDWDLTIQRLEPHIDGKKFVRRIAVDAGMELALVRRCLRQLLYYRAIAMVDVFQYSNAYKPTRLLAKLAESDALQFECLRAVLVNPPNPLVFSVHGASAARPVQCADSATAQWCGLAPVVAATLVNTSGLGGFTSTARRHSSCSASLSASLASARVGLYAFEYWNTSTIATARQ